MGTKGTWQRDKSVSEDEWAQNYARTFKHVPDLDKINQKLTRIGAWVKPHGDDWKVKWQSHRFHISHLETDIAKDPTAALYSACCRVIGAVFPQPPAVGDATGQP